MAPIPSWLELAGEPRLGQLVRAEPVLALLREVGGGTLLDVGRGGYGLAALVDERWAVTTVDSPRTLPFPDASFDVVVALDVVEHVPAAQRSAVLHQLGRIARRRVIVSAPVGREALEADRALASSLRRVPPWLAEHVARGLPFADDVAVPLRAWGPVRVIPNESIGAHVRLARREATLAWLGPARLAAWALARGLRDGRPWALRALGRLRGGDRPPVYRVVAVAEIAASSSPSSSSASVA